MIRLQGKSDDDHIILLKWFFVKRSSQPIERSARILTFVRLWLVVVVSDVVILSTPVVSGAVLGEWRGKTAIADCEQLYECKFWGPTTSNPTDDPNPRLEAYIDAARRGAEVRILLDSVFDDPGDVRGNTATCAYVNGLASLEGLDLACKLGNPTGGGIHNKMMLANDGGRGYVHTGSINGSENSSKNNREFAMQVQSNEAYAYLADVFWYDWPVDLDYSVFLPVVMRDLRLMAL